MAQRSTVINVGVIAAEEPVERHVSNAASILSDVHLRT